MAPRDRHRLLALAVVIGIAGCGADPAGATPGPTTSQSTSSTTTTASPPRADASTTDLATKATITLADLGDAWTVHADGRESDSVAVDDCAAGRPAAALPAGARWTGSQFKTREARWFVYTASAVFPDEPTALEWVEVRKSAPYVECRRAEIEKGQQSADPRFSVAVAQTTTEGLGSNGFEAYVLYHLKADVDTGPRNSNATFAHHTYRVGRTVVALSIDIASDNTDPADHVTTDVTRALTAVYQRVGQG